MTYRVQLLPSGLHFDSAPRETVLESALRAGSNVNYGCSNGNCGLCRARLLAGSIEPCGHSDYHLREDEQAAGVFLMCVHCAASDLRIEASEARGSNDIPLQEITARVRRIEALPDGPIVLRLRSQRSRRLRFLAGQHVRLVLAPGLLREAAIASCPCDDLHLEFHLPGDASDAVRYLTQLMKVGDRVGVQGPSGNFVLDDDSERAPLMVAIDTGFAPIKSLIEHALALDEDRELDLIWLSRPGGHYLGNLCRAWADALDGFEYRGVEVDDPAGPDDWCGALATALDAVAGPATRDVYVCAPQPLLPGLARTLQDRGVPAGQIRVEPVRPT